MSWESHWLGRDGAYYAHRQIAGPLASTLLGDSNTEGFWWNTIGTERFVNAGYGGINTSQMLARMPTINAGSTPKYTIIMLGTNDALPFPFNPNPTQYCLNINNIIDSLENSGSQVLVTSVPPIEPNCSASASRSQASVNTLNAELVYSICQPRGLTLINLNTLFMDMTTGQGRVGFTRDGIHLTRLSYVSLYNLFNTTLQSL